MAWTFQTHLQRLGPHSPRRLWSLPAARAYCQKVTRVHYENFSVLSCFVPTGLLPDFRAVYAFCRWSDDLGDEVGDEARSLELLDWWESLFLSSLKLESQPDHPVIVALADTMRRRSIPPSPFLDLISAFRQDQRVKAYDSMSQLLDYCSRSANPVGRIVLHLAGQFSPEKAALSDEICTGLQLANFWQDIARDRLMGRTYIPADHLARHQVSAQDLDSSTAPDNLRRLVRELVESTRGHFQRGAKLDHELPFPINRQIRLFRLGGERVLDAIENQGYDTLRKRPRVTKVDKLRLLASVVTGPVPQAASLIKPRDALARSKAWCRRVARTQAGNFFPAFRLLPRDQFDAMCALYAFMRATDDLADETGSSTKDLLEWENSLAKALLGSPSHPCHAALVDACSRFPINPAWLRETITGVRQDMGTVRIADRAELEAYCYKVASVVGLCCLAIWGADTEENRALAIPAGYAMQLTNILRDIREDKARDRIYIPSTILEKHGLMAADFPREGPAFIALYRGMAGLAQEYFRAARPLGAKLPRAGAAMYGGIIGIYAALLDEMEADPEATLVQRASLPGWRKAAIIAGAWAGSISARGR
ncbi:MAG: squalene synthase HpnC [Planctomycetota bacterium]